MLLNRNTFLTAILAGSFALATPALAVTVMNKDDTKHEVTFDRGTEEQKLSVEAGKSVMGECPEGCGVRIASDGHDTMAEGDANLVIEDGELNWGDSQS